MIQEAHFSATPRFTALLDTALGAQALSCLAAFRKVCGGLALSRLPPRHRAPARSSARCQLVQLIVRSAVTGCLRMTTVLALLESVQEHLSHQDGISFASTLQQPHTTPV